MDPDPGQLHQDPPACFDLSIILTFISKVKVEDTRKVLVCAQVQPVLPFEERGLRLSICLCELRRGQQGLHRLQGVLARYPSTV